MKNRLTVNEAAKLMGADAQFIRIAMQRGHLQIGHAEMKSSVYTYYISTYKFAEYTGIPLSEIEKFLSRAENNANRAARSE